ncbi:probable mitochondrial chaperone bcs1 [Phtheirospermum japonicum]|uniref:Probable mitochondrial chaperone bcs1 n=1 Tax=Phtheirospermum japonicum TaxID=374723 RepID=A0A830BB57_9LAMI|nr:probable mitochondrial chaperone bcs1 [Phtheirospermum japonicum]
MQSLGEMQSMAANIFSAYASMAASMMLFRSIANDVIPDPIKSFFYNSFGPFIKHLIDKFFTKKPTHITLVVDEQNGMLRNQIYDAAEIYLRTKINPDSDRLKVTKSSKQSNITLNIVKDQVVVDRFNGFELKWQFVLVEPDGDRRKYQSEKRYFELTFDKSNKDTVVNDYLPLVLSRAVEIKEKDRAVKLYTRDCPFNDNDDDENGNGYWGSVNLDHPVTFDKLAMDPNLKRAVIEDLDRFLRRKEYYRKVGKAWKRGYLLYGPPGTGKSSLVAAMANYLKFDVYDLELTSIYSNSDLRRTLLCTNNKSIIVIEDIDCSVQMHDREGDSDDHGDSSDKLTLSGVLNFIDGLWSTCGDERIIIFTTNHKEKLDPALLRPGRMDMHIHMGYCTPEGFDVLAFNYLGIKDHPRLVLEIKELIREIEITPAEVAEHLMRNEDVDLALQGVLDLLKQKEEEKNRVIVEKEAKENKVDEDGDENTKAIEKKKNGKFGRIVRNLTQSRRGSKRKM